ncbi:hypothetical protein SUGI_0975450 [Cryptomeria japonica]|nr:hypothetical protein SUGI_0975450 [Cryptomeria japonica]
MSPPQMTRGFPWTMHSHCLCNIAVTNPLKTTDNMNKADFGKFVSQYEDLKSHTFLLGLQDTRSFKKRVKRRSCEIE